MGWQKTPSKEQNEKLAACTRVRGPKRDCSEARYSRAGIAAVMMA